MIARFVILLLVLAVVYAEKDYTADVNKLKANILDQKQNFYHGAYNKLAYISDSYGPRLWGSKALETVINWVKK
jgi:hypothetical protein